MLQQQAFTTRTILRCVAPAMMTATLMVSAGLATPGLAAGPAQNGSAWSGVFTEEQVARGEEAYAQECAACHLDDLLGDGIAPPLVGVPFSFRWTDLSVGDMYAAIRTTMPQGAPASLSPQDYVDIVAFMLAANDFPAGDEELPTDEEALQAIIIDEQP